MARRIAMSTLNASTIDIINTIRANATYDYQQAVPEITKSTDIPVVGEIIMGTPALSNTFVNSLLNRIAIVAVKSATFNNPYGILKKGYLEFGETIEDIFVQIAKAVDFDPEKAPKREFQRTLPKVESAFYVMNWRVLYPITIQNEDLKQAFLSLNGMESFISKLVESVYTAAEYDEFLLFKYLLIKSISKGKMYPVSIGDGTDLNVCAEQFRGMSNMMTFMKSEYNERNVKTTTPKNRQVIFMDALFNAKYDVEVLARAFNMDKADFMGRLLLIDDFTTFDNERFDVIRENSTGIEEVTEDELALLKNVTAVLLDEEWFQVYDNNNVFTEKYVASGLYWNYFYHTWKTVAYSPFANSIVFCKSTATITLPEEITVKIGDKSASAEATTLTLLPQFEAASLEPQNVNFVQTEALTTAGIGVHPYGALLIPHSQSTTTITLVATIQGTTYTASSTIQSSANVGDTVTLTKG